MAVVRSVFVCQQCDYRAPKWLGRCPECDAWASLVEEREGVASKHVAWERRPQPAVPFSEVSPADAERTPTGIPELDRVLGGGLVAGAVVLIGGEPGIGKSTLLLQAAAALAGSGARILYVTAEESSAQLRLRGDRLGVSGATLLVLAETDVGAILEAARSVDAVIVDSIQAVRCAELESVPGSVGQVREAASRFVGLAKATGVPVLLVGHVTKEGSLAGPRTLEHVVDAIVQFEGDRHHAHRLLRSIKNRFGPADELGVFTMTDRGLAGVASPSEIFLAERRDGEPGSAVLAAIEGTRALLVEIQALVGEPSQGTPRRTALGVDGGRLALILAVLQRRAGLDLASRDVFVNVPGGIEIAEPAADLAIALAAASSLSRRPLPRKRAVIGELGLGGEIRSVSRLDARLKEAARLGFTGALVPASAAGIAPPSGLKLIPVRHVGDALAELAAP